MNQSDFKVKRQGPRQQRKEKQRLQNETGTKEESEKLDFVNPERRQYFQQENKDSHHKDQKSHLYQNVTRPVRQGPTYREISNELNNSF